MKVTFWGAARQVTGSMHLIELEDGFRILFDCGLDYEQQRHFFENPSSHFPFDPASIHCIVLSHAHVDHSGNIPNLVKQGFFGPIYCTSATAELTKHLLMDSANIQAYETKMALKKVKKSKGKKPRVPEPLYQSKHVNAALQQFSIRDFHQPFPIHPNAMVEFSGAGHLLGAAMTKLMVNENGKQTVLGFTGDIGRPNSKLVPDPEPLNGLDYLISESTYGGRKHKIQLSAEEELLGHITRTCVEKRGRLVIPAFSVGRTQSIVFTLNQLHQKGLLPAIKVYVDSPLAIKSTNIYASYLEMLNEEARNFYKKHGDLFEFPQLELIENDMESRALRDVFEPAIIVSAAGMVEGGRIQEHIRNHIQNPYATILIAGFCAPGTLGHRLLMGQSTISIKNREFPVYATVTNTDVFSSHGDHDTLVDIISKTNQQNALKHVFLVHGEPTGMEALKADLGELKERTLFPAKGDSFSL